MSNLIDRIAEKQINPNVPEFRVGDTVAVYVKIDEKVQKGKNNKAPETVNQRIQKFEGVVISRKGAGISETFTVRKKSAGIGVERIFPVHSPKIDSLEVIKKGKVRRAKLYFLRDKIGQFKIKERK